MPGKDTEEFIQGPGKTLPKDQVEVVALKPPVLCEYPKGKSGLAFDCARLLPELTCQPDS